MDNNKSREEAQESRRRSRTFVGAGDQVENPQELSEHRNVGPEDQVGAQEYKGPQEFSRCHHAMMFEVVFLTYSESNLEQSQNCSSSFG